MRFLATAVVLLTAVGEVRATNPELQAWLSAHPRERGAIRWARCNISPESTAHCPAAQAASGNSHSGCRCDSTNITLLTYDEWTQPMQDELHAAYALRVAGDAMEILDPPPYVPPMSSFATPAKRLAVETVWSIYLASLAQSLWWEIHGGAWSMSDLGEGDLRQILDSIAFAEEEYPRTVPALSGGWAGNVWKERAYTYTTVTPGNPATIFDYLLKQDLVGESRKDTIVRFLNWARMRAIHSSGSFNSISARTAQWQYEGPAPVTRILNGTRSDQDSRKLSRIPGCHGMTALMRWVLRTVNIPVGAPREIVSKTGHSTTHFMSEDAYLSHGDDYRLIFPAKSGGAHPIESVDPHTGAVVWGSKDDYDMSCLLIDQRAFDAWFVNPDRAEASANIGRGKGQCLLSVPGSPQNLEIGSGAN